MSATAINMTNYNCNICDETDVLTCAFLPPARFWKNYKTKKNKSPKKGWTKQWLKSGVVLGWWSMLGWHRLPLFSARIKVQYHLWWAGASCSCLWAFEEVGRGWAWESFLGVLLWSWSGCDVMEPLCSGPLPFSMLSRRETRVQTHVPIFCYETFSA